MYKLEADHAYHVLDNVSKYDLLRDIDPVARDSYAQQVVNLVSGTVAQIADVGFGTGNFLLHASKIHNSSLVYGVDNSLEMHKYAICEGFDSSKLFLSVTELLRVVGQVDLLHFKAILHCVSSPQNFISSMIEAVKPGGLIVTSHEFSLTEDRIEQIFNYTQSNDVEVEAVFRRYFDLRIEMGKPFKNREFPAGDSMTAVHAMVAFDQCEFVETISSEDLSWLRIITVHDFLECVEYGTFGVFFDGLDLRERLVLRNGLEVFCKSNNIDIYKSRSLPCEFKINVVRKK